MALLKCKMCGGSLEVSAGETIIECDYCGTQQTLPKTTDENIQTLFNRANLLRQKSEFDKAEAVYEKILEADDTEAEAYWGVILCKFGIEYVEDPKTYKRIPTCHRTSYDSIIADEYYKKAIEHASISGRSIYEAEAKNIDKIQKGILAISAQEEPYDVFICYKETDENGKRTQDSVIANDIYYQLKQEGFKVFYAAITLEGELGSAYEPIIFAALNSSKVMLAIGTKPEYFNAVWVKNEWSRFLKIMKADRSKILIPCYRDMDAYELPEEFAHLQAQDMSKIGFINDIVRGISKVINKSPHVVASSNVAVANSSIAPLLERISLFLEDGDWHNAAEYCEKVLDQDPKNALAYLGKLMIDLKVQERADLATLAIPFSSNANYSKVVRFASADLKNEIEGYLNKVQEKFNETQGATNYEKATKLLANAKTKTDFLEVAEKFKALGNYRDAKKMYDDCILRGNNIEKDVIYSNAIRIIKTATKESEIDKAVQLLSSIPGYLDSDSLISNCKSIWEQDFKRYNTLITNYKLLSQKATDVPIEQQLKNKIAQFSADKSHLECLMESFPTDSNELATSELELAAKVDKQALLKVERSHLGLFAGKRKKEIDWNVSVLQNEIDILQAKRSQLKNKLGEYSNVEAIRTRINAIENDIQIAKADLAEFEASASASLDDVVTELLSENIFRFVLVVPDVLSELLKDSSVMNSIMNREELSSKLYGVELPKRVIDELEGTDDELYYVHRKDRRTEEQLVSDFAKHFDNTYFSDYEIVRDVDPTYFGAHRKCKPIQFLFKKNGKDVLAVAIVTYTSITHPAVKSVQKACEARDIEYLRFIVGYPNTEHYVVRRTLEELKEIPKHTK